MGKVPPLLRQYQTYDGISAIGGGKPGSLAYISGDETLPEGVWRRDVHGDWHFGATTTRTQVDADQTTVGAGNTQALTQFELPTTLENALGNTVNISAEMVIWQGHIGRITGDPSGLQIEVEDTDASNTFYTRAASDGREIDIGFPLAQGGQAGNQIRIRVRNNSGQQKTAVGFIVYSLEFHEG